MSSFTPIRATGVIIAMSITLITKATSSLRFHFLSNICIINEYLLVSIQYILRRHLLSRGGSRGGVLGVRTPKLHKERKNVAPVPAKTSHFST